jgi:hypothetical protein
MRFRRIPVRPTRQMSRAPQPTHDCTDGRARRLHLDVGLQIRVLRGSSVMSDGLSAREPRRYPPVDRRCGMAGPRLPGPMDRRILVLLGQIQGMEPIDL